MAKAIKTLLLEALKADIEAISEIKEASLNPMTLPKGDDFTKTRPFTCLIDMPETPREDNRYRLCMFDLVIITYIHADKYEDMTTDLDEMHALIYRKMLSQDATHRDYSVQTKEKTSEKMFFSENEGCIIDTYEMSYKHIRGNPYTINP